MYVVSVRSTYSLVAWNWSMDNNNKTNDFLTNPKHNEQ